MSSRLCNTQARPGGDWLSRLERTVHIREVTGSNPVSPTSPVLFAWAGERYPQIQPNSRPPGLYNLGSVASFAPSAASAGRKQAHEEPQCTPDHRLRETRPGELFDEHAPRYLVSVAGRSAVTSAADVLGCREWVGGPTTAPSSSVVRHVPTVAQA
jgi:hypothetical protein